MPEGAASGSVVREVVPVGSVAGTVEVVLLGSVAGTVEVVLLGSVAGDPPLTPTTSMAPRSSRWYAPIRYPLRLIESPGGTRVG
ncbi:hypothetical protein GCM10009530_55360 [Microbispora corallina]|uniref:Uncharacterized protein n=1 Tax=Microbispora corallina TaxID=83302 RepID=A0ABQ4G747_9ACTN|nr:hypothetical protein Mco01_58610 [Microbispora corallina]